MNSDTKLLLVFVIIACFATGIFVNSTREVRKQAPVEEALELPTQSVASQLQ